MPILSVFLEYLAAFGAGVIVSFTPCVYPVLPLVVSFIAGANTQGTKRKGFVLACVYVFGIALTYSALGMAAALTGQVFGHWQVSPWVFLIIGCFLILFGLIMLDKISFPGFLANSKKPIKPKGFGAVLVFGMVSGLAVGPCTAPVLGTLLLYAGSKQNLIYAASLLFVFAYGVGFSLILAGTFSGFLTRLPRSGQWLSRIKQASGIILLAVGMFYLYKAVFSFIAVF